MHKHIDFLGILYIVWGGLSALVAVAALALAVAAASLLSRETNGPNQIGVAALMAAGTFTVLGVASLLWGLIHLWVGFAVRRRRTWARTVALGLGIFNLFLLPFGTALGSYTLWVLLDDESRRLFERPLAA